MLSFFFGVVCHCFGSFDTNMRWCLNVGDANYKHTRFRNSAESKHLRLMCNIAQMSNTNKEKLFIIIMDWPFSHSYRIYGAGIEAINKVMIENREHVDKMRIKNFYYLFVDLGVVTNKIASIYICNCNEK